MDAPGTRAGWPWLTTGIALLATLATAAWGGWLGTEGVAVADGWLATPSGVAGQPWRLVLGPLVHADFGHLLRDLPIFVALSLWAERRVERFVPLLLLALAVPIVAVLLLPDVAGYLGLSGAINTLLVLFVTETLRRYEGSARDRAVLALATAHGLKLLYEGLTGQLLFPMESGDGVEAAHLADLIGAAVGALGALWVRSPPLGAPLWSPRLPPPPAPV